MRREDGGGVRGRVLVVSGPSGAGKGTLIRRVLENAGNIYYSISATTRPPGEGEVDGSEYHFLTEEEFNRLVERGEFLEWEEVYGNRYGTLRGEVERAVSRGEDVLLELDVKGALAVQEKLEDAVLIFIMPPSLADLESRLRARGRDGSVEIEERIESAPWEMQARRHFDIVIINDDVGRAAGHLEAALRGEKA